ncbi:hypothetical protein PSTG_02652 [Puccinia striiformis f. sp. tritici PST-78]|uniref:Uncharacterized protein n=1 Tax=Puccinia striiformis f. sp. tritici PST-78 TaxID=1165861 RepID=A0A0L0VZ63_9BASI|nr:hypothetical protein PSTG_02652 [Puccinia striiformis f. sp. tritici PST-78]
MPLHDQPNSKRQKTIFDFFGDLADQGNRLPMQVDTQVDDVADHIGARIESADAAHPAAGNRESGGSLPSDSSTDGPEPNRVSTGIESLVRTQSRAHLDSPRLESSSVHETPDDLHVGQAEPDTAGSKKRSRGSLADNSDFHQRSRPAQEKQTIEHLPAEEMRGMPDRGDESQDFIRSAFDHKPGDFEVMSPSRKWAPLFKLANEFAEHKEKPPSIKKLNKRFDEEIAVVQSEMRRAAIDDTIELSNLPITLIPIDHPSRAKGRRDLLIKPAGVSSRTGAPERRLDDTKHRIAKILVALECFHRLAREHGIDDRIFGYQTMSDHSDLSDWFIGILFEKSEDSYPLFGHFQNEWPKTAQPEKMFGSVQKVMSIILMNWKRPKIVNINEVALSLLGHWYKITALKLGRSYLTHHPDTYWSMMARIIKEQPLRRAGLLRKLNEEASVFKYHNGDEDFFTINSERLMSREISMWQSSLFDLIESRRKTDLGSGMTKYIRERIEKKIREGVPRGPNSRDFEQRVEGLPISILPISMLDEGPEIPRKKKVSIRLIQDKEYQRRKSNQYTLLERRITEIFESLNILHKIASEKNLDSKILGSGTADTHEQLMTWYLDVLFSEKSDSLPIFGTVKILFPPDRPLGNLFGSAQKFLSITLSRLGKFKKTHSNRIALLLLGFWYQETALKLGRNTSGDDELYWKLMRTIAN